MKHWVIYIILLFCCTSIFGQVTVTTQLGPPPYKAGEPMQLQLEVRIQEGVEISGYGPEQLEEEFTILKDPEFQKIQNGQETILKKVLEIAPKKYGDLMLSAIAIGYKLDGKERVTFSKYKKITVQDAGRGQPLNTPATPVDESVALMNEMMASMNNKGTEELGMGGSSGAASNDPIANPYGEIKDIKPIIKEPLKFQDFLPYLIAIFILVALISAIFHYLNKRKQPEEAPEPEVWIPAHKTALADLTALKNKQLWQNGSVKAYQTELTHIIRKFLENRFEINALEMTSDDIVYHLKKKTSVSGPQQSKVKDILQIADLVKFAKANPPVNINEQFWSDAENFVQENKTDEIPLSFLQRQPGYQAEQALNQDGVTAVVAGTTTVANTVSNNLSSKMLAGRVERFVAMLLDSIAFTLLYTLVAGSIYFLVGVQNLSPTVAILFYVFLLSLGFLFFWIIYGYYNSNHRQTLGKKITGIVVTDKNGGPLPLSKASMRSLIFFATSVFVLPYLWIFFDKEKQTLHDKAVNSKVIQQKYRKTVDAIDD